MYVQYDLKFECTELYIPNNFKLQKNITTCLIHFSYIKYISCLIVSASQVAANLANTTVSLYRGKDTQAYCDTIVLCV